jgi:hypothetical protein
VSIRENVEREFRFHLANDPLAQQIGLWRPGDAAIVATPDDVMASLKNYVVALHKTLLFLADETDRLNIERGES